MVILYLLFTFYNFVSTPHFCRDERSIKFHHEIIFKVIRHSSAILCCIAGYRVVLLIYPNKRTVIKCVYHDIRIFTFRESKSKISRTFCRSDLRLYIVVSQIYTIIIRSCRLSLMREPATSLVLQKLFIPGHRHQRKLPVIINPRTGLMCLLKSFYLIICITIGPSISHISRLRCPEVHSPRQCNGRVGITCR